MTDVVCIEIDFDEVVVDRSLSELVPYANGAAWMKSAKQGTPTERIKFKVKELIHFSRPTELVCEGVVIDEYPPQVRQEREVWCGSLTGLSGIPEEERSRICCKFVRGSEQIKRLRREADIYSERLSTLQGNLVPRFYGFFENEEQACILLEWVGTRLCTDDAWFYEDGSVTPTEDRARTM